MSAPVFRFAPSPNGRLHLGHAYSALLNQHHARRTGGRLLLRIEDIDLGRCSPDFEAGIFEDIAWLGVGWEEPVRRQSTQFELYRSALQRLIEEELVYPAFMSRTEMRAHIVAAEAGGAIWPRDPDGAPAYPSLDRRRSKRDRAKLMAQGAPFAWRLDMEAAIEAVGPLHWTELSGDRLGDAISIEGHPEVWGDAVLARRDVPTSYHLSVVVDDHWQGVSHVVRGADLRDATSLHRVLQALLGMRPPAYHHHRLILGPDGRKLSKSAGDSGISALREQGETPAAIRRKVGLADEEKARRSPRS